MNAQNRPETFLPATNEAETNDVLLLLSQLTEDEQRQMLSFMQGVKFAKASQTATASA